MISIVTLQPIGQRLCVRNASWTVWSLLLLLTVWAPLTYGQTESSSFENGSYAPYILETCCGNDATVVAPTFGARNGSNALKFFWAEDNWDPAVNSRTMRGIECRSDKRAKEDQWFGFSMYVPSQEFPSNKNIILAQLISFSSACPTDKTVVLGLTGTTLKLEGYKGDQTTNVVSTASGTLTTALPRDRWIDVVIHARYSKNGTGLLEGWFDGAPLSNPTFRATNINLSTGCFDANDNLLYGCYPKFGMYCYDKDNYTDHETRTVYYDDVKWLDGNPANAYEVVKPAGSVPNCGTKLPWTNSPFAPEAGAFVAETDVTPNANRIDGIVGLANGNASGYAGVACAVLFSPDGTIKARNGSAYTALEVVPYSANASYHLLIEVNVPTRKYNVYVTTPDGIRHAIG
ncbi:MAG: heparin lyase I family protein, partial [Bacteroidetes bacterium]|nr:heparin lyase I family protein [Fibrella sp.]